MTTHHHFDHTAGLRAAIAEGLTVVTHSGNKAFVEAMAARPHTIQSDALAKSPKAVTVTTVDEELKVDRILPLHGAAVPFGELVKAVK